MAPRKTFREEEIASGKQLVAAVKRGAAERAAKGPITPSADLIDPGLGEPTIPEPTILEVEEAPEEPEAEPSRLSPTFREASPEMQKTIEQMFVDGPPPEEVGEREKIIALAKNIQAQPRFRDKLLKKMREGGFSKEVATRIEVASNLLQQGMATTPKDELLEPEKFSAFLDILKAQTLEVGPTPETKIRVSLNTDLRTGETTFDIPSTYRATLGKYARQFFQDEGLDSLTAPQEDVNRIWQKSRDKALHDTAAAAMRARNISHYDPDVVKVKELAKSPIRGVKAHLKRVTPHGEGKFGAFNPTVEELEKEGLLQYIFRAASMFDHGAPKHQIVRDRLKKEGEPMGVAELWMSAYVAFNPIASNLLLEQLGVTPEEEVEAYMRGTTMLEENQKLFHEFTSTTLSALGVSGAQKKRLEKAARMGGDFSPIEGFGDFSEVTKERVAASLYSVGGTLTAFVPYLWEPEVIISGGVFGIGKAFRGIKVAAETAAVRKAASTMATMARDSTTTLAKTLNALERVHVGAARHAEATIVGRTGTQKKTIDKIVSELEERREKAGAARERLRERLPEGDIDDLAAIVREAKADPEILKTLTDDLEVSARGVGRLEGELLGLNKDVGDLEKILEAQNLAKITSDSLKGKLDKLTAEILLATKKSKALQEYLNADNIFIRLKETQKLALKAEDAAGVTEATNKLKSATATRLKLRKKLSPKEKKLMERLRKEGRTNSRIYQRELSKRLDDTVIDALKEKVKQSQLAASEHGKALAQAQDALAASSRRFTAVDPKASRKFAQELKAKNITGTARDTIQINRKLVGDFVGKERRLAKAQKASEWRKHARELAEEYELAAKETRKTIREMGTIAQKRGVLNADIDGGISLFAKAVQKVTKTFDPARFKLTEAADEGGRKLTIESLDSPKTTLAAMVSDDTPDLLRVDSLTTAGAKAVEGAGATPDAINTLRSAIEYAHRNNLGLDLGSKGVRGIAGLLRASGVPLNKSGRISAKSVQGLDMAQVQGRIESHSAEILLDGRGLRAKMEAAFGLEATAHVLSRTGNDGKLLAKALDAAEPIRITSKQAENIQMELGPILARASKVLGPANKAANLSKTLFLAKSHLPVKATLPWLAQRFTWIARTFDPWLRRLGTASEEVALAVRAGDNFIEMTWDEYSRILKMSGQGEEAITRATYRYLDSTSKMMVSRNEISVMNLASKTLFQRAKKGILGADPDSLVYTGGGTVEEAMKTNNPAVLGLSRMWLAPGEVATEKLSGVLFADAIRNLRKSSSAEEFIELQRKSTVPHFRAQKGADPRVGRVHAFATRSFIVGAAYEEVGLLTRKASGGLLTAEEALDMNRLLSGAYQDITDTEKVFQNMQMMGLSILERETVIGREGLLSLGQAITETKKIVKFATEDSGEAIFGLGLARQELDKSLSRYIKSLAASSPAERSIDVDFVRRVGKFLAHGWQTDAVIGVGIPNAGRIVFDRFGDTGQWAFSDGFGFAARATFQNVWTDVPFVGRWMQDRISRAAREGNPMLRSLLETTFNPHLDDIWQGRAGAIRMGKNGPLVSFDYLRKRAVLEGILDARVGTEVLDLAQRVAEDDIFMRKIMDATRWYDKGIRGVSNWQDVIARGMQSAQQRQRMGTFALHIHDGRSFDEAARLTRNAIYDWRHGMSEGEVLYILRSLPFIRWARLTASQFKRGLLEPLTIPAWEAVGKSASGQTKIARLRTMYRAQEDALPYLMDPRSPEEIAAEEGYRNAIAPALKPQYLHGSYPNIGTRPHSEADLARNEKLYGDSLRTTHRTGILPPNSMIEMGQMSTALPQMAMAVTLAIQGEHAAATDLMIKSAEPALGMLYPTHRDLAESLLGLSQRTNSPPGFPVPITPTQNQMLKMVGVETEASPETGQHYTGVIAGRVLLSLPGMAMTFPRLIDSALYRNPGAGQSLAKQAAFFALGYSRLLRIVDYNVFDEHERLRKKVSLAGKAQEKKAGLE